MELKKINKICTKVAKKHEYYRINRYSSDSESSLSSDNY